MDILELKFKNNLLTQFKNHFLQLEALDKMLCAEVEGIEEKSMIVKRKWLFFKDRRIDYDKVDKANMDKLLDVFHNLLGNEADIITEWSKVRKAFTPADDNDKHMVAYIQRELRRIFTTLHVVQGLVKEIQEYLTEFKSEELAEDIEHLHVQLDTFRRFIRHIEYYTEYWIKRKLNVININLTCKVHESLTPMIIN
jgi:hypothetical protein